VVSTLSFRWLPSTVSHRLEAMQILLYLLLSYLLFAALLSLGLVRLASVLNVP
jgi:hypothetical protein